MKKLIAVSALTAAFAAFAGEGPFVTEDFDSLTAGPLLTVGSEWNFEGSGEDGSLVQAYEGSEVTPPNLPAVPTWDGKSENNTKFLALSTEGGILWRGFGTYSQGAFPAQAIPETGLYVDTLVQFTPTEDGGTPDPVDGEKLAIWLNVSTPEGAAAPVTNLMVKAAYVDEDKATPYDAKVYTLVTPAPIEAGKWYRLTVKSIADCTKAYGGDSEYEDQAITGFQIMIDGGSPLAATEATFGDDYLAAAAGTDGGWIPQSDPAYALMTSRTLFPSLAGKNAFSTLSSVGFKGSGAIDDLVLTTEDPFYVESVDFTLTWADGLSPVSYTIGEGEPVTTGLTSGMKIPAPAGQLVKLTFTNGDGAKKVFSAIAGDAVNSLNVTEVTYGWPEYLGDAVDGAYEIDDAAELVLFQKGVNNAKLATADETFKLTADVALTDPWPGVGVYNVNPGEANCAFRGTFDGAGYKISNVVMADNGDGKNNYRGFFNQLEGATVKDLTVATTGFGANPPNGEYGAAAIAGYAYASTLQGCTAEGTIASGKHNVGGITVRVRGSTLQSCTNKVNITGNYTKVAGIAVITQNEATGETTLFDGCVNEGTITCANGDTAGRDGCAGIVAYIGTPNVVTIKDCENKGSIVKGTGCSSAAITGQIVAYYYRTLAFSGNNKGTDDQLMIGKIEGGQSCLNHFATVDDGVATLCADSALAVGDTYKVMAPGGAPTIELAEGQSITFDQSLATIDATGITAVDGCQIVATGLGQPITYTAVKDAPAWPTEDDWDDVEDVDDAVEAKLDAWKSAFSVTDTAGAAKAFLLNVAPGNTLPDLKIESITVDGTTATVVVSAAGVDLAGVNGVLYVEGSNDLANWTATEIELGTAATFTEGKATFTVTAAKFMKAKIGFKTPVLPVQ